MQQVISELDRLRRRGRLLLVLQRSAAVLACVIGGLVACILFDFALRLPGPFRLVMLLVGAGALAYALWRYVRSALVFSPSLTELALRVERVLPGVSGRLASSVEFATAGVDRANAMAARSVRETQTRLAGESVSEVIASKRTWRNAALLLAIAAAAGGLAIAFPATAATGMARLLMPLGDTKWPARTGVQSLMHSVVAAQGVHPRGQALPLRARVTRGGDEQRVDAHYRLRIDGAYQPWQRIVLTHQGRGVHERLVDTNAEEIELFFTTDDDETSSEVIELAPPPAVRRASLTVTPPAYAASRVPVLEAELGQGIDDRAVTDSPSLVGSMASLRLELNKPLPTPEAADASWIGATFGWSEASQPRFSVNQDDPALWTLQWRIEGTRALSLKLVDEHGLANAEPISFRIEAVEDAPPAVTITNPQADEAVLPTAVIPLEAEARDDVALASHSLEAHVQSASQSADVAMAQPPAWAHGQETTEPSATIAAELDLGALHVSEGDVVLVTGLAEDSYEFDGVRHERARSPARRLRVIDAVDFATQLRRQLGAVRQNAIRIEALQAELQDDVIDDGVQAGMDRAQAQIGERIASQRASVEDIERLLQQNRLDDPQLGEILQQTQDLLDFAGRSANKAVEAIEQRAAAKASSSSALPAAEPVEGARNGTPQAAPPQATGQAPPNRSGKPEASNQPANGTSEPSSQEAGRDPQDAKPDEDFREPDEQDRAVVEAQQEVRDELADLIKLLDRDEDTWVVKRQLEELLEQQAQLEQATGRLGEQTIGRRPDDLTAQQRTELDRIAQKQRDELREQAQKLIEEMRERAKALEQADPQAAESMRSAADTAEQRQLDRDMEEAAKHIEQNQMTSATARQQSAQSTLSQMLTDIDQAKRAHAQQLIRQLASLIESIQRLITVQENELTALAMARDTQNFAGLDRSMIRLNQNTQSVAGEARAAGQESRRIARSLDRAADAQGAAVAALRAAPVNADDAQASEDRSLELLKEAKALAEELQKKTEEEAVRKKREELMEAYRKFAERQVSIRADTLPLQGIPQLDRRQLVEARRLGTAQDEVRVGLNQLRDITSEILDSPVFSHVHRLIDTWSAAVTEALQAGSVTVDATDRQQRIADSIGRLVQALEESMAPPDEFVREQQQQEGEGASQGGQQPLIPPIAQLKLLQGLQEQVYNLTKDLDGRTDLDAAQRRTRLRELGEQQRELMQLGQQMLEALQQQQDQPEPSPENPDELPQPEPGQPEPQVPVP